MSTVTSLFRRLVRLNESTDLPRWCMQVWDDSAQVWHTLGGSGHATTPIVAEGLRPYAISEVLCFPGDPPDLVSFGGDVLYLRSWQPDLLTTASGDLMVAEGLD